MRPDEQPSGDSPEPKARYVGLLTQVMSNSLDEGYRSVARDRAAGSRPPRSGGISGLLVGLGLFGVLIGVAALSTQQDQPRLEAEREGLIDQIMAREDRLDDLQGSISDLDDEITRLRADVAVEAESSSALQQRVETLGISAGTIPVEGPGMVITVDDAPGADPLSGGVIRDRDLQALVNGLWMVGAEAIAINGNRLTSLTAIRFAGQAITVDYRSITPPYVVDAIGNPDTMPAEFTQTEGGQLWTSLELNFGIQYNYETPESIAVPADPHEHLNYARQAER